MSKRLMALYAIGSVMGMIAMACGGAAAPTATPTKAPAAAATPAPAAATPTRAVAQPTATVAPAQPTATARPAATAAPAGARPTGQATGVMLLADMQTDPHRISGGTTMPISGSQSDFLLRWTHEQKLEPGLARSWELSADKTVWTFNLREAKFHNGDPITAEDAAFSIERALKLPGSYLVGEFQRNIARAEAVGKSQVKVYTKGPYTLFLARERISQLFPIVPKKVVEQLGDEEFARRPVSSGPFKIKRFVRAEFIEFEAFEEYWGQKASVKSLVLKDVPEETTRLAMLRLGEADFTYPVSPLMAAAIAATPGLWVLNHPYSGGGMSFNPNDLIFPEPSPLKDLRVRQALSYAIDRKAIAEKIFRGYAKPTGSVIRLERDWVEYPPHPLDVEKAKKLLVEAGYPDGFTVTLNFSDSAINPGIPVVVEAVQGMWEKIGVKAQLKRYEHGDFLARRRAKQFRGIDSLLQGSLANALTSAIYFRTGETHSYVSNAELDRLYGLLDSELDQNKVDEYTQAFAKIVYDEVLHFPIIRVPSLYAASSRVLEWKPFYSGSLNLASLKLKQ